MYAQVADHLVVHGARAGRADRMGEVVEVVAGQGPSRYRVRWSDGHESIYSPGADAEIDPQARARSEWNARVRARRAGSAARRRGLTAGVGREASLAQERLDRVASAGTTPEAAPIA